MEDILQILLYVGFLLIYLVSKAFNNKRKKPVTLEPDQEVQRDFSDPSRPRQSPEVDLGGGKSGMDEPPRRRRESTFDRKWREFTETNTQDQDEEEPDEVSTPRRRARQKIEELQKPSEQQVATYRDKASGTVRQVRSFSKADQSLQEIDQMTQGLRRDKDYQRSSSKPIAREIARTLKQSKTARQAIILGEILNRKHF